MGSKKGTVWVCAEVLVDELEILLLSGDMDIDAGNKARVASGTGLSVLLHKKISLSVLHCLPVFL